MALMAFALLYSAYIHGVIAFALKIKYTKKDFLGDDASMFCCHVGSFLSSWFV